MNPILGWKNQKIRFPRWCFNSILPVNWCLNHCGVTLVTLLVHKAAAWRCNLYTRRHGEIRYWWRRSKTVPSSSVLSILDQLLNLIMAVLKVLVQNGFGKVLMEELHAASAVEIEIVACALLSTSPQVSHLFSPPLCEGSRSLYSPPNRTSPH